jgi:hypothetical protein
MLVLALVMLLWQAPASATTTTPLVPNDVGHWLNLEHRTGKLAPDIAEDRHLIQAILVVERSLAKVDAYLTETRRTAGCHQLLLPYTRVATHRKVRQEAWLPVGVCSSIEQRVVFWESDGSLIILGRPRNDAGGFPRTLYALFRMSAEERARWTLRSERLAARGKVPKPPKVETVYMPAGDQPILRNDAPMIGPFGAEFGLPTITGGRHGSDEPTSGLPPPEWDLPDR